jgi:2-oxoglutarate dehydrogenase E1 component
VKVTTPSSGDLDEFYGPNAGWALDLLERNGQRRARGESLLAVEEPSTELAASPEVSAAAAAAALAQSIRLFGHRAAHLDPLGSEPPGDPHLEYGAHGLTEDDLARLPPSVVGGALSRGGLVNARVAIHELERIYCGTTGYEISHVEDPDERAWLLEAIEEERFRPPNDPVDERELLDRLTEVSAFERFLHRAYPGQTRFSVEGLGMLIPMLDELVADGAAHGARTMFLGMGHRGRLNVLAHVLGKPYDRILAEFEGRAPARARAPSESNDEGWTGDVKYHAGARRVVSDGPGDQRDGAARRSVTVVMVPNPSHLEFVNPVVEGMARAANADHSSLAVLIHGDASFPGQGIVAETLNLARLRGYTTSGTLHIIANNQLGFTTEPRDARSTLYASDLAKGFEIPIVHVNADDPIGCLAAIRLGVAYRARFGQDFLIDLIGYRRWGHNEGDDPSFTQPRTYAAVDRQPTVRERFAADLVRRGAVRAGDPEAFLKAGLDEFQHIRDGVRREATRRVDEGSVNLSAVEEPVLSLPKESATPARRIDAPTWQDLKTLNSALLTFPEGFSIHPKLNRALERRRVAFDKPDAAIDWAHAETLALATLVDEGVPIRLTGQDTARGTFSQRHLTFYDARTGAAFTPLQVMASRGTFEVFNSPLSESATLGFEYGYSVQSPETLVVWEGQYGDFINGAQVIVDEFLVSAQAKWGLVSGLTLLLPHAWEGQGPDHSSGRLERFLGLAAEDNIRVVNCTTAAQYYFLVRRQASGLGLAARPLVAMTPKSLLRHPLAASRASDLVDGHFQPVLDDARAAAHPNRVRRVVLCSGHIWAEVAADARYARAEDVALVRIEELYPFPREAVCDVLDRYGSAREVIWLQEEPSNMGAWSFVERRLRDLRELRYVGRPKRASPAEGWAEAHSAEQRRIISEVIEGVPAHAG